MKTRNLSTALAVAFGSLFSVTAAFGQTINGTGYKGIVNNGTANTGNWSNSGNWDKTGPGFNERNLFFGQAYKAAGGTNFISNNDIAGYAGYRITFQDSNAAGNGTDGSSANDTAFTITGNCFTLFDFGGNDFPRIENNSFVTQTFTLTSGNTITLSGTGGGGKAEINPVNGDLVFSTGTKIDLAGTTQLFIFGGTGKTVTFNDVISSSGNGGLNSVVIKGGTAVYGAANTYGGGTFIDNGTVKLGINGAILSTSSVQLGSGTTSGVLDLNSKTQTLAGLTTNGTGAANNVVNTGATSGTLTLNIASVV